jgi:hypothetical protein
MSTFQSLYIIKVTILSVEHVGKIYHPSLKVKWSIPKFTTLILHFDSVGSTQYTNIVGKYKNYLYELQKLPLANHESYFLCSSNIVTTLTDLRESWDWNMSVNLNIIVHNMYMYISVCPSIAHCNHRRCDSPSDNHCEYCYYEEVDKRYFRGYTRHYDGQMKQCRSKYIRCTIIYQQQYVVETIKQTFYYNCQNPV